MLKPVLAFLILFSALGCHAQKPTLSMPESIAVAKPLSPATARRVEVLLRKKANVPPGSVINVGVPVAAEISGYVLVPITITNEGTTSHPINFLLSNDGKTLAQLTKYDISQDPRDSISADGRPSRGGPVTAPVLIVGFDDLECPFCARLHESIFPAITNRYGDRVRIVYKDFPLSEIHPWAMRAAVDVNCLGAQSTEGYWNLVDGIHAHASEISHASQDTTPDPAKQLESASATLDKLTREQGKLQHVDAAKLDACIAKQDTTAMEASRNLAASLNLESTPVLFINGDKIDGAVPIEFIFSVIDNALVAEGHVPPPPYVAPKPPAPAAAATKDTAPKK